MQLVIVESPTKARKLSGYLGKGVMVEASVGHIRDLPKSGLGVDVDNDFEPIYEVSEGKGTVVKKLQQLAQKADEVVLATDPDREGEAIAWHLQELLAGDAAGSKKKIDPKIIKRATFHEITKKAVLDALEKPGQVSQDLVDAQQARRIVDRLVGYKVSPVLWKKIRRGLSAGRVQSVALRLIVEREREIENFKPDEYWEVDVLFSIDGAQTDAPKVIISLSEADAEATEKPAWLDESPEDTLVAQVTHVDGKKFSPTNQEQSQVATKILESKQGQHLITSVERKERKRSSLPPFTTSTLQQQAATRLGMTSKQTMRLAQQLYEEGLITYHRTDSVNLSQQALGMAREYLQSTYGSHYIPEKPRYFSSKSKNAQEAHEAIRVTDPKVTADQVPAAGAKMTARHQKLYELIWRRFLASQMKSAIYDQTAVLIDSKASATDSQTITLKANGSVLKFDGWMKLFPQRQDRILPDVQEGQQLGANEIFAAQKFTQPPPRYNDASLVKELEKRGIGRPSTYASIISVIEDRGYVTRDQKRFVATPVGMTVCDFLVKHFETIMDYDFTAEMEEDLDRIARNEKEWKSILRSFYTPFAKTIEKVEETADRAKVPVEKTGEECPTCRENVEKGELAAQEIGEIVIRSGRFGKFKSCSRFPDCKFTQNIVEKLDGQNCPLCEEGDIIIKKSRWGKPFFGCGRYPDCDWASWKKPEPGLKISAAEWKQMQEERKERMAKRKKTKSSKKSKKTTKKTKKTTKKKKATPSKKKKSA